MATKVIGKLDDWDDGDVGGNDFMRLEEGSNPVRIFTKPYQFYIVWTEDATGKSRKIRSSLKNCPLVARGETPKPRWYVGALNRKQGSKPCILEIGPQIFNQIKDLRNMKSWGDPRTYDIDINRKPRGSNPLYGTVPEAKKPLTDEEKTAIKEFTSRVDLDQMTAAPTPEEVREMLGEAAPTSSSVDNDFDDFDGGSTSQADDDFDFADV